MKTRLPRRGCAALASLSLMTAMLAAGAAAQMPDAPDGFGGPPPGQNGGPPPAGPNGRPGGTGRGGNGRIGFPGRPPFAAGTVSAVDTGAGTITITSQPGDGASQAIKVNSDAQLLTQSIVAVADLKVGDQVQVQGIPTGISVSSLTVGLAPIGLPGAGGFGGPGGAAAPSFAAAQGTVKSLPTKADPYLMVSLGADIQISLKIADGAKITRYAALKIADIKNGDRIMASGQTAADGSLAAGMVAVNLPAPDGFGGPNGPGR